MKHISFIIFLVLIQVQGFTQTAIPVEFNKSFIPPSPEAASLGKFGIVPVTLYEGMPNTSIPVYEIKTNKLSLPISLQYNYNGFRPGEDASWIGMGWSLQGSGVITRVIKGLIDGESPTAIHEWKDYANILDVASLTEIQKEIIDKHIDAEPDLYIFNFNGHAGKFILVGDRAFIFPHQDLKITRYATGFKIVDENGSTYAFIDNELTTPQAANGSGLPVNYISSWNLSSIISADLKDQINFTYADWTYKQYNDKYSEMYVQDVGNKPGVSCLGTTSSCDVWQENQSPGPWIHPKRLVSIKCKGLEIDFIPETNQRLDLHSSCITGFALKEINVNRVDNSVTPNVVTLFKKMQLVHEYFGNNDQLKLKKINLIGYNAANTSGKALNDFYKLDYANETNGSFPKTTRSIDKYGYYNGAPNNTLFDNSIVGYATPGYYASANREVNVTTAINGILSKITYPTGGFTNFEYENNMLQGIGGPATHQFQITGEAINPNLPYSTPIAVAASDIKSFVISEAQNVSILWSREIPSGGSNGPYEHNVNKILNLYLRGTPGDDTANPPVPDGPPTLVFASSNLSPSVSQGSSTVYLTPGNYYFTIKCETNAYRANGTVIYTKIVSQSAAPIPGPGMRIKKILSYDLLNPNSPGLTKTYSYQDGIRLSLEGYGATTTMYNHNAGSYSETIFTSNSNSPLFSLAGIQFYYPSVTEENFSEAGGGKTVYEYIGDGMSALGINLTKQTDYAFKTGSNSFVKIKEKTNTYAEKLIANFMACTVEFAESNIFSPYNLAFTPSQYDMTIRTNRYNTKPYALTSDWYQLKTTVENNYDAVGLNPINNHIDYFYDNDNYMQPSRVVTKNTKQEIVTTQTKFPYDCAASSICNFPAYNIQQFLAKRAAASTAYYQSRQDLVIALQNGTINYWDQWLANHNNSSNLVSVLNAHPCETNYLSNYQTLLSSIATDPCPNQTGYSDVGTTSMQLYHITNVPVEQIVSVNKNNVEYLLDAVKNEFTVNGMYGVAPITISKAKKSSIILKSDFITNPLNYYEPRIYFKYYPTENILKEQWKANDVHTEYLWDYSNQFVTSQCIGGKDLNLSQADLEAGLQSNFDIAATSFEADGKGNFTFSGLPILAVDAPTGKKAYPLTGNDISKSLDPSKIYTVSLWANGSTTVNNLAPIKTGRTVGSFTFYEYLVTNASTLTISGSGNIDELRLYPKDALMTTYTYNPLIGMTSQCDANNRITYYEYDVFNRLALVRDQDNNILKKICYNYAGQVEDCPSQSNVNTNPIWVSTGNTRCVPCIINSAYNSGVKEKEEINSNPNSANPNATRWVIDPSGTCPTPADWQTNSAVCETNSAGNTGNQILSQTDVNPCSATSGSSRQILVNYPQACAVSATCNPACPNTPDYKCINGTCTQGVWSVVKVSRISRVSWDCYWYYCFPDGTLSTYFEVINNTSACQITCF